MCLDELVAEAMASRMLDAVSGAQTLRSCLRVFLARGHAGRRLLDQLGDDIGV